MAPLTREDLDHVKAQWEEWTSGLGFDLDVQIVGEHSAEMDPDRPLGAIVKAKLSVRLQMRKDSVLVFDEACPYDGRAVRASVRAVARRLAEFSSPPTG